MHWTCLCLVYRFLFSTTSPSQANPFFFPPLLYPTPPPPSLLFQSDAPFRLYQEAFFRSLLDQYSHQLLPPPLPLLPLSPIQPVPVERTAENCSTVEDAPKKLPSLPPSPQNSKVRRRLSCSQCSYTTNRLNNLKRHIQTMHEVLSEPIDCCDQLFTSKAHFRAHVNTEHRCGYHCDTCRRTFCRKALLRRHQSIHSGQKAFICRICSYSTSHKGNLDRHARVHRHHHD